MGWRQTNDGDGGCSLLFVAGITSFAGDVEGNSTAVYFNLWGTKSENVIQ